MKSLTSRRRCFENATYLERNSEAIRLNPNLAEAYNNRALAYRQIGREDLAKADESTAKGLRGK